WCARVTINSGDITAIGGFLPVLTTDCAWVPRLVADGAGIVVPVGDADAFSAALKRLADNPALRQRMGAAGRDLVLSRHAWPASARILHQLYGTLGRRKFNPSDSGLNEVQ
ncbi:MAG TPA: glycosyltransferase, partial [Kiritimatiellia bacterium]|nr:glycosyltransferase [Kiritimatiellia bacterium]